MMPSLPADLFTDDDAEAPRTDLCRPHGIPFNRDNLPPDDEITDRFAALAADIDEFGAVGCPPPGAPTRPGSTAESSTRGAWWNGVPL